MPIPKEQDNDKYKVRCPFCDNVLCTGNFIGKLQMYCIKKQDKGCKRKLEITATEKGVKVEEVEDVK